jgi:hypothetical protein
VCYYSALATKGEYLVTYGRHISITSLESVLLNNEHLCDHIYYTTMVTAQITPQQVTGPHVPSKNLIELRTVLHAETPMTRKLCIRFHHRDRLLSILKGCPEFITSSARPPRWHQPFISSLAQIVELACKLLPTLRIILTRAFRFWPSPAPGRS